MKQKGPSTLTYGKGRTLLFNYWNSVVLAVQASSGSSLVLFFKLRVFLLRSIQWPSVFIFFNTAIQTTDSWPASLNLPAEVLVRTLIRTYFYSAVCCCLRPMAVVFSTYLPHAFFFMLTEMIQVTGSRQNKPQKAVGNASSSFSSVKRKIPST